MNLKFEQRLELACVSVVDWWCIMLKRFLNIDEVFPLAWSKSKEVLIKLFELFINGTFINVIVNLKLCWIVIRVLLLVDGSKDKLFESLWSIQTVVHLEEDLGITRLDKTFFLGARLYYHLDVRVHFKLLFRDKYNAVYVERRIHFHGLEIRIQHLVYLKGETFILEVSLPVVFVHDKYSEGEAVVGLHRLADALLNQLFLFKLRLYRLLSL